MAWIEVHQDKIDNPGQAVALCPFGAILEKNGRVVIDENCRMCLICVKQGPSGAFALHEETAADVGTEDHWSGIAVYTEIENGGVHPVSLELIGKARELGEKAGQPVSAILIGSRLDGAVETVLKYGADIVFLYEHPDLLHFRPEPFASVMERHVLDEKPSIILAGGTVHGRSFAPRAAARLKTGLTADCTFLEYHPEHGLEQIRPAFGGNIMAHIRTPSARPQFATVRYKIFPPPSPVKHPGGRVVRKTVDPSYLASGVKVLEKRQKPAEVRIEDADSIVVVGRGFRRKDDLAMACELAELLGAQIAGTRPVIEDGWVDPLRQIGLSGRTVQPKLIITLGVSGSVQFAAGMSSSGTIMAVNRDSRAPIFKIAHYGMVADLYDLVPALISKLKGGSI